MATRPEKKVRVTSNPGTYIWALGASQDGKRLAVGLGRHPFEIYMGNLSTTGEKLEDTKRLVNDSWNEWPNAWSVDGQTLYYRSARKTSVMYKHNISSGTSEPFLGGTAYRWETPTPDGKWVLVTNRISPDKLTISRVPVGGGSVEVIAEQKGTTNLFCGSTPSSICVSSEEIGKQNVFSRLDPMKGKVEELARMDISNDTDVEIGLSPDGGKVAVVEGFADSLRILDLKTRKVEVIHPNPPQVKMQGVAWSADGKHLFVSAFPFLNGSLQGRMLEMDLQGRDHVILENPYGWIGPPCPSPDGKHLAFTYVVQETNVTLFENF